MSYRGMVPKGGLEPPRVTSHAPQTCASTSSATSACPWNKGTRKFKHLRVSTSRIDRDYGSDWIRIETSVASHPYFFVGCGVAVITVENGVGVGTAVVGVGVACGKSVTPDCSTELVPLMAGSDKIKAISMNAAAAPMVTFANRVCVPRGPNAVLETELLKSAPASALPGCSRMTRIKTTQARMNNP